MQRPTPWTISFAAMWDSAKPKWPWRAAFKAILDGKQVALLAPTTILALQHYNSFKNRFQNFPVNIEYLSRFKTQKPLPLLLKKISAKSIDIIIGTHKLLGKNITFNDLGLVIVDEEQRFGVAHKEKLKLLKCNVDFLTLTATPIPRTLQMSLLGLREISLIKTPPPKRQDIKTYVIRENNATIQSAIDKELRRGGQVFIVHNRVQNIESYARCIRELVPSASIVIGHGQLPEKDLEKRISAFYKGQYQILISTTIIESGLDIPNANTLIVNRADAYGLSQLHQLRGRIGRSDKKAYAYFVIPGNRVLSSTAEKRLFALQTYSGVGAGFNIAQCDLEIRGAGDLLGAEQSGHIEAIGLELYMELLEDATRELKGEKKLFNKNIEINTPFPCFIPKHYISNPGERLKQYKRLSNCHNLDDIGQFYGEFEDIFGPIPPELQNLLILLESRILMQSTGLQSLSLNSFKITLHFDREALNHNPELKSRIVETFKSIDPDYKILYKSKKSFNPESFLEFCRTMAKKILPS